MINMNGIVERLFKLRQTWYGAKIVSSGEELYFTTVMRVLPQDREASLEMSVLPLSGSGDQGGFGMSNLGYCGIPLPQLLLNKTAVIKIS